MKGLGSDNDTRSLERFKEMTVNSYSITDKINYKQAEKKCKQTFLLISAHQVTLSA